MRAYTAGIVVLVDGPTGVQSLEIPEKAFGMHIGEGYLRQGEGKAVEGGSRVLSPSSPLSLPPFLPFHNMH